MSSHLLTMVRVYQAPSGLQEAVEELVAITFGGDSDEVKTVISMTNRQVGVLAQSRDLARPILDTMRPSLLAAKPDVTDGNTAAGR